MFSEPAVGETFFGREEVLELLNKRAFALKDGYRQNVALSGPSLVGKSSIILHFLNIIKEEGFVPVYVEVIKEPFRNFSNKFIATMLYNALAKLGEYAGVEFDRLLERAGKVIPKTYQAITKINSAVDRQDLDEAYSLLLGLTSILKNETGIPCIVIFDEFDNLEYIGVKNPFLNFGKVIMVQKDTMYIVSSSRNEAIKKIISEKLSLLFGNFEVVNVSNFSLNASADYLDIKLPGYEIDYRLVKFLIAFTDGNPFYLNKIASLARSVASERMSAYISQDIIADAIVELVYNSNGSIHQYLYNFILELLDLKFKDYVISILMAIANGLGKKQDIARSLKAKQADISKWLVRLAELGLISKNGAFFTMNDTMLAFWLKHVYQKRKALLIDGVLDKRKLFSEDVHSYLSSYIEDFDKSVVSRIAELFNIFSNEVVQIDSKQMRLPYFTKVEIRSFQDAKSYIAASFRGDFWIAQPYEHNINENDIVNYVRDVKELGHKISHKIIIPLKGIDENAKLLAKELRILIWGSHTINTLLLLYGKNRIIVL